MKTGNEVLTELREGIKKLQQQTEAKDAGDMSRYLAGKKVAWENVLYLIDNLMDPAKES